MTTAQQREIDFFYRHSAADADRMRGIAAAERRAKDQQRRDAMVDVMWRALKAGIDVAPDLFPALDAHELAIRLVDDLILGGRP